MSVASATMKTQQERNPMKRYEVLTGELVAIYAEDEDEMWELLADGAYEEIETLSEIQSEEEVKDNA